MKTTKEKLIASALKLFNEKGFEKTSTTSICTDAGFSSSATSGMFYSMVEFVRNNEKTSIEEAVDLIMKFVLK